MNDEDLMVLCNRVIARGHTGPDGAVLLAESLRERLLKEQKQWPHYACHCDLEPHMQPDRCVLDDNKPEDCIYARRVIRDQGGDKTKCEYWLPVVKKA